MNMEMPLVSRRCLFASNDYQDRLQQRRKIRQAVVEAHQGGQMGTSYANRIRAETIPQAETIRLYPAESKMPAGAEGVLVLLHGCGVDASQSSTMRKSLIGSVPTSDGRRRKRQAAPCL